MDSKDISINPIIVFSKWFMCNDVSEISNEELKELEEWCRRTNQKEHIWVKYQLDERGIKPYKYIKVWNENKFKYEECDKVRIFTKDIYPKTVRVSDKIRVILTEKLDGGNIGIFKFNGELLISTRRSMIIIDSPTDTDGLEALFNTYMGLSEWIKSHYNELLDNLHDGSGFFAEWKMKGKIYYENLNKNLYMFAKAKIDDEMRPYNIMYDQKLFIYPFLDQCIPDYIGVTPIICELDHMPSIAELDDIYDRYVEEVGRRVEGIVINHDDRIQKYVRYKRGKFTKHKPGGC